MSAKIRTWWGNKFIDALTRFMDEGRLSRGRGYASDHRILKFDIIDHTITATVRGNVNPYFGVYKEPKYKTEITIKPIEADKWPIILKRIVKNVSFVSSFIMNEMPDNIESVFAEEKLSFLPISRKDIVSDCSCPDYANPCKHIAGVYYRLAAILDENPFLLFQLRGLPLPQLMLELQKSELGKALYQELASSDDIAIPNDDTFFTPIETIKIPKNTTQNDFWFYNASQPATSEVPTSNQLRGILIKKNGDFPSFWNKQQSFASAMSEVYTFLQKKNKSIL